MNPSMQHFSRLTGIFMALTSLLASANPGQSACPILLTEPECHDYQAARDQAKSKADRSLLEDKYAALLKERSRLCPVPSAWTKSR